MAWSSPRTWTTGELVTAALMNTHIRDNLNALFSPPGTTASITTDITTTSTSFEDATGLTITFTIAGDSVLLGFVAAISNSSGPTSLTTLTIDIDGTDEGGTEGIMQTESKGQANSPGDASFTWRKTGLSSASHTFKMEWKVSGNTSTMHATNSEVIFWGAEIS